MAQSPLSWPMLHFGPISLRTVCPAYLLPAKASQLPAPPQRQTPPSTSPATR